MTEISSVELLNFLPEIELIGDQSLKNGVVNTWKLAFKNTSWKRIEDVPFVSDAVPGVSLMQHTRAVVQAAIQLAKIMEETHGIKVELDKVVAGAVLHDVSKLVEYEAPDGRQASHIGERFPHGFYGAVFAIQAGLPDEIAHLIVSHTHTSPVVPQTMEGIIIRDADYAVANIALGGKLEEMLRGYHK